MAFVDIGFISSGGAKLLWENNDLTTFNAQTISLDLSKFKMCIVEFTWHSTMPQLKIRTLLTKNDADFSCGISMKSTEQNLE